MGVEPATFRATAKHATYCATEATSSHNLKLFIIFGEKWKILSFFLKIYMEDHYVL